MVCFLHLAWTKSVPEEAWLAVCVSLWLDRMPCPSTSPVCRACGCASPLSARIRMQAYGEKYPRLQYHNMFVPLSRRMDPDHAGCKAWLTKVRSLTRLEDDGDSAAAQNDHKTAVEKVSQARQRCLQ